MKFNRPVSGNQFTFVFFSAPSRKVRDPIRRCPTNARDITDPKDQQPRNHFATPSQNLPQHHTTTFPLHFKMADSQPPKSQAALFQVYLRLRPPPTPAPNSSTQQQSPTPERFLSVEDAINDGALPTHITLNPPNDNRRRAVEKFAFTKVFEEDSSQLDLFRGTGVVELVEGVLGRSGGEGRDGLLATLGVTGSGKVC
jgi:hypothetical protein